MSSLELDQTQQDLAQQHRWYAERRSGIGLVITEQCPVGCRHCLSSCNMQFPDLPALETHLAWVAKVAQVKLCKEIVITGGEPFLYFKRLVEVVASCYRNGLGVSVYTSAYWADSEKIVADRLLQLAEAGLTGITLSTDEYHQEYIPLANVARVVCAAKDFGIKPTIALTYFAREQNAVQVKREIQREFDQDTLDGVHIKAGGIVRLGRALELEYPEIRMAQHSKLVCNAIGPVIQPNGTVASCCRAPLPDTSPLILGNLNSEGFAPIYQRFLSHPLIPFIQAWGLIEMLERLISQGLAEELKDYRNAVEEQICEICQAIFSVEANISFYSQLFNIPEERKQLGILTFLLYGDTSLLENLGG